MRTEMELDQWRILELEIADAPLEPEAFDPTPFTRSNRWSARVYTNGGIYDIATNGTLQLEYRLPEKGRAFSAGPRKIPALFYACWAGLNAAILALLVGAKEEKTNQKVTNERTDYEI